MFSSRACALRQKLVLNGAVELIMDEPGDSLFLVSKSKNQFFQHRELLLGW